jgi:hypothetical protein
MHSADLSLEDTQRDLVLVRAARAGSEAAFAELHRLYARRL